MHTFLIILIIIAMAATLAVLIKGVIGMIRGGDPRRSNKLMQQRVMFQLIALVLLAVFMMMYRQH
jgi:hypothetical protein